jgi:hypothetical protein
MKHLTLSAEQFKAFCILMESLGFVFNEEDMQFEGIHAEIPVAYSSVDKTFTVRC